MARPSSWLYVWVLLAATVGGLLFTPLARRFATRLGVVDEPAGHKTHLEAVSLLGGLGIYAGAFAAAWTLAGGARNELKGFFLAGLVILVFGVQDDITPMDPWVKLAAQVSVGLVLVGFGVQVRLTDVGWLDVALSVAWVVAVVNAFNFQDNMNGLAAGLAAVASGGLFVLAVTEQQYLVAVLSAGVAGGALGFLPSNYPRARVFMGDAGSMFLGFVLAFLGIRLRFLDRAQSTTFLIPVLLLGVPLFDAALVIVSRLRRGISVAQGGADHTSHRLVHLGLHARDAVAALWGVQLLLCLGAIAIARLGRAADWTVIGLAAALALAALFWLEREPATTHLPRGLNRDEAA